MTSTIPSLSVSQIRSLSTTAIAAWTTEDIAALSTTQVRALSSGQIAALETEDFAAFSTAQIGAIAPASIGGLSLDQYSNRAAFRAHSEGTMREIAEQLGHDRAERSVRADLGVHQHGLAAVRGVGLRRHLGLLHVRAHTSPRPARNSTSRSAAVPSSVTFSPAARSGRVSAETITER